LEELFLKKGSNEYYEYSIILWWKKKLFIINI